MQKKLFLTFVLALCFSTTCGFTQEAPLKTIQLVEPQLNRGKLLMQALKDRKSSRDFSEKDLSIDVLSNLLWAATGINRSKEGLLTNPTASNMQEIDVYVAMKTGLYLYNRKQHSLDLTLQKDIRKYVGIQNFTETAPVNLIFVTDYSRMKRHPRDSQIFYSATDTGYISQNVYLFCASEGLATVVLGWVDKKQLSQAMGLKEHQAIILTQPVGYPQ